VNTPGLGAVTSFAVAVGLSAAVQLCVADVSPAALVGAIAALLAGSACELTLRRSPVAVPFRLLVQTLAPFVAMLVLAGLMAIPGNPGIASSFLVGTWLIRAMTVGRWTKAAWTVMTVPVVTIAGLMTGAGAWSVDEPAPSAPAMVAGNGVVVADDTHAFLIQQGAVILRHDGRAAVADFLATPDPTAPLQRTTAGSMRQYRETYLWRVELGSRDADRVLKKRAAPDHFFNWWTHSGRGLIAGTSAATWAEQQFSLAVQSWRTGDRANAMYHLGTATHLVDDACAPPHASQYVPDHRAYEEWVVAWQAQFAQTGGGIYRTDFRVRGGHGGREWSSSHTRGWVDECAHRAAELIVNTAQPPPEDPSGTTPYSNTMQHFRDAQRLTAGYLAFFFETVGGP
jgi:hypothetical protein